jgi:hypothetical protein
MSAATTAFGFDRLVQGLHKGNAGTRTGATSRSGGAQHLAMSDTKLTACGRVINSSYSLIVPLHGLSGEEWAARQVTCASCRKIVGVK